MVTIGGSLEEHAASAETAREPVSRSVLVGRVVLGYALVASIVPIYPSMPELGLDASWRVAINRAAAQGMQFGQDIVFTYGPYGGVLSGVYEPGIRTLVIAASVVLATGFVAAALLTLRRSSAITHFCAALAVIVLTSLPSQGLDGLTLVYPLLVVAAVRELREAERLRTLVVVILALPFGLLPIMKLSLVPAVGAAVLAVGFLLVRRRAWGLVAALAAVPLVSLVMWWSAAHQSILALPDYARSSWYMLAGYSEAMSLHETSRLPAGAGTAAYLVAATVLLVTAVLTRRDTEGLVLAGISAVTLFLAFKAGFVRSAAGHMQSATVAILAAAVVVLGGRVLRAGPPRTLVTLTIVGAALACWLCAPVGNPVTDTSDRTIGLVRHVIRGDAWSSSLRHRYAAAMASIRKQASLPHAQGPTDLYTSTLNLLFAQGARWDPRPVIQSYSAYTPELARMNARHLTGPDAPRTIFFQIGPIDGRLPALEDGTSWVPLLENYDVRPEVSGYLVLQHRPSPRPAIVGKRSQTLKGRLGGRIRLPDLTPGTEWLASFDVRPTLLGRIRNVVWKGPQLQIEVRTADGTTAVHRFIPTMARSNFVLSPYVADTDGLRSLFPGQTVTTPPGRAVTSIRVLGESSSAGRFWASDFSLKLTSVEIQP